MINGAPYLVVSRYVDAPFQSAEALAFEESHSLHTEGTEDFIAGSDDGNYFSGRRSRGCSMFVVCDMLLFFSLAPS